MNVTRRRIAGATIAISALCAGSCSKSPAPAQQEIVDTLSRLILDPDMTCTELRRRFGVEHLPVADTPADAGLAFEDHRIATPTGPALHAWYLPAQQDRGTVIVSMGAVGEMACYLLIAQVLTEQGWSVVMYEYQGFGQSGGKTSLASLDADLEAVLDWSRTHTDREQITLLGISLGTIPSVAVAVQRPEAVNALVLDSPVVMGEELERYAYHLGGNAAAYAARLNDELVSERIIGRLRCPLLVLMNEDDSVTPPATVEALFARAPEPKHMVRFAGREHARGLYFDTDRYSAELDAFLDGIWTDATTATTRPGP